jgi:Fic family protein
MFSLGKTPYSLDSEAETQVASRLKHIEDRMAILRTQGALNDSTLRNYYGEKRFEQVAESNGIEGSTLSVGETQLAVMKGITITGHDPAYVRDAIALDKALEKLTELARKREPTTIGMVQDIHALALGDRPGAGAFRRDRVRISGSNHTPPKTWEAVMTGMEEWEAWSKETSELPAPVRCAVLHAWLAHVHPYSDGNGRTARAVGNLELIRAGYPPVIIKRKERDRYIQSLSESDSGGDIRSFMELILDKVDQSLTGLELSAKKMQGFDPIAVQIRSIQQSQLKVWTTSVELLSSMIELHLRDLTQTNGVRISLKQFDEPIDIDEYVELCNGRSVPQSWAFIFSVSIPGRPVFEVLGYIGHRSHTMYRSFKETGAPSLYLARKNPSGFPKWVTDESSAYYLSEATIETGSGDSWRIRTPSGSMIDHQTSDLAMRVARCILEKAIT